MWVAFYKGRGDIMTRAIRFFGCSTYSHVGLVFLNGQRFDASGRVGLCRWVQHDFDADWDEYPLDVTIEQHAKAYAFLDNMRGLPFDFFGVLRFLFPLLRQGHGWYCTQLTALVMREHLGVRAPEACRPRDLVKAVLASYKRRKV